MFRKFLVSAIFVLTGVMFLLIFSQVVLRYVLLKPLSWSEEASRYLMIWIICLAASEAYARGEHVGLSFLQNSISSKNQKWSKIFIHGVVSILMVVISYFGFCLSFSLGDQRSPALDLPMTFPYLAIPVGALLILIQTLASIFREVTAHPENDGTDVINQPRDSGTS